MSGNIPPPLPGRKKIFSMFPGGGATGVACRRLMSVAPRGAEHTTDNDGRNGRRRRVKSAGYCPKRNSYSREYKNPLTIV